MQYIFFSALLIFIILLIYFIYSFVKVDKDSNDDDEPININNNQSENNSNTNNPNQYYLYKKLDDLEEKLDRNYGIMIFLIVLIIVATGLILYFTYKWTYYIQPDTINGLIKNTSNQISNMFQ